MKYENECFPSVTIEQQVYWDEIVSKSMLAVSPSVSKKSTEGHLIVWMLNVHNRQNLTISVIKYLHYFCFYWALLQRDSYLYLEWKDFFYSYLLFSSLCVDLYFAFLHITHKTVQLINRSVAFRSVTFVIVWLQISFFFFFYFRPVFFHQLFAWCPSALCNEVIMDR